MTARRPSINLHVAMNGVQFASRILKETASLVESGEVDHVYVAGLLEEGLPEHEAIDAKRTIWRASLRTRTWSRTLAVQAIKYVEFCWRVARYARRVRATVVNVHSLELLPLGVLLKMVCGAKLVYDAHELETETNLMTGHRQQMARIIERLCICRADMVIVVGDAINQWYRRRYGLDNVVTVMNCPKYRPYQPTTRLHASLGLEPHQPIVLYQGGLVAGRGIEGLIEACTSEGRPPHALVCMGYGPLAPMIERVSREHPNVHLQPAVDPGVVLEYTSSASVGVAYIDNSSLNDYLCLPNKFFEYIMGGVPVIVNAAPEMKRVVEEYGLGVVLTELSAASLRGAIETIARRDAAALSANLQRAARVFCWEEQARVMIDAYRRHIFGARSAS